MMNRELDFIKEMFDTIAPSYDFLNRFLSLRQDVYWRREMVAAAKLQPGSRILDVACGTCDVALEARKQAGASVAITGTDFSPGMLVLGKQKIARARADSISLAAGNALCLPFKSSLFDAVFIAFGIRNIIDRKGALQSFHRVLKENGTVTVLELTTPGKGIFRDLYLLYFKTILPALGGWFSQSSGAYRYLPQSVLNFPEPEDFAATMREAGFTRIQWKRMTLGIVTLFTGTRG